MGELEYNVFMNGLTLIVVASGLQPEKPDYIKYFLVIDSNALSFGPPEDGVRNVHIELATCMFNAPGLPLQYNRQSIGQKFTQTEHQSITTHAISPPIPSLPKA